MDEGQRKTKAREKDDYRKVVSRNRPTIVDLANREAQRST
jgi:hypothetical protein